MKILISGSSGLIGSALVPLLSSAGHELSALVRGRGNPAVSSIPWQPGLPVTGGPGQLDLAALEGFEAVIHLAGEKIAGRWSPEKKERIRNSRVQGTRHLCEALERLERPPRVLLCASACGIYGDRGDEPLTEESGHGKGFLADVVRQWEAATDPASRAGIRVVNLRFAMVLSPRGDPLAAMLPLFRLGLGGPLGGGRQFTSWVAIDDVTGAIAHALDTGTLSGPVNIATPHPVRNAEFAAILGRVLHRPALLPAPAFALRLLFGSLADEVLLASQRLVPERLQASGYLFRHPDLFPALNHLLNPPPG